MTLEEVYGTRPDLLPSAMVRLARAGEASDRRIVWLGRPGVKLLDIQEHRRYERESLGGYPRDADGTVEWAEVPEGIVICSSDSDCIDIEQLVEANFSKSSDLFFFWGILAIPSVKMNTETALANISGIVEKNPEFWMYSPEDQLFLEHAFSGSVTLAHVMI